jgi:hypothetical protein
MNPTPSPRAKGLWHRLQQWYGSRLAENYGAEPPADWCAVVDALANSEVKAGLAVIRARYVTHPPTLPEFEQAMRPPKNRPAIAGHTNAEQLCSYVAKHHFSRLTPKQQRGPWTYLGAPDGTITGLLIAEDQGSPAIRLMLADIGISQVTER